MGEKETKSTLKVCGILCIIMGVFGVSLGIMTFAGMQIASGQVDGMASLTGPLLIISIVAILASIVGLLLGIFSVRASNDFSQAGPAYVLSIVDLAITVASAVVNVMNGINFSSIVSTVVGLMFSVIIFRAAKAAKEFAANGINQPEAA